MKIKFCVYCKLKINRQDDYFKVELYSGGKKKCCDFSHRNCHLNQSAQKNELNTLINGLAYYARERGMLPAKEIVL